MTKLLYTTLVAFMVAGCSSVPSAAVGEQTSAVPSPIGYDAYNATSTAHLKATLAKTASVSIPVSGKEHALTAAETAELLALLEGATSAMPRCAPADCLYLNLADKDGNWLMSLPVQHTPQGIVLLYLKLQGNNAAAPLQNWWQGITDRLSL